MFDATEMVNKARAYYDELLRAKIKRISELSGVDEENLIPINPCDFIENCKNTHFIEGYKYQSIGNWLKKTKTDENYLISPLDADTETANQIAYKEHSECTKVRASKCEVRAIPGEIARNFYIKNHRQTIPQVTNRSISFGLVKDHELLCCMTYDVTDGGVRGNKNKKYELLRLAIKHGFQIQGGASRLQKHCEEALRSLGETEIYSYSNATINNGNVYKQLGFEEGKIDSGQPFVIMEDFRIVRLISLFPNSTNKKLAMRKRLKCHIGGNKMWTKKI